MDHWRSLGIVVAAVRGGRGSPRSSGGDGAHRLVGAINFLGNPRFRPRVAYKVACTSGDMDDRKEMLVHHTLLV
jgi:hypothetical protein